MGILLAYKLGYIILWMCLSFKTVSLFKYESPSLIRYSETVRRAILKFAWWDLCVVLLESSRYTLLQMWMHDTVMIYTYVHFTKQQIKPTILHQFGMSITSTISV